MRSRPVSSHLDPGALWAGPLLAVGALFSSRESCDLTAPCVTSVCTAGRGSALGCSHFAAMQRGHVPTAGALGLRPGSSGSAQA